MRDNGQRIGQKLTMIWSNNNQKYCRTQRRNQHLDFLIGQSFLRRFCVKIWEWNNKRKHFIEQCIHDIIFQTRNKTLCYDWWKKFFFINHLKATLEHVEILKKNCQWLRKEIIMQLPAYLVYIISKKITNWWT